jgi:hypothetical protein
MPDHIVSSPVILDDAAIRDIESKIGAEVKFIIVVDKNLRVHPEPLLGYEGALKGYGSEDPHPNKRKVLIDIPPILQDIESLAYGWVKIHGIWYCG